MKLTTRRTPRRRRNNNPARRVVSIIIARRVDLRDSMIQAKATLNWNHHQTVPKRFLARRERKGWRSYATLSMKKKKMRKCRTLMSLKSRTAKNPLTRTKMAVTLCKMLRWISFPRLMDWLNKMTMTKQKKLKRLMEGSNRLASPSIPIPRHQTRSRQATRWELLPKAKLFHLLPLPWFTMTRTRRKRRTSSLTRTPRWLFHFKINRSATRRTSHTPWTS